MRPSGPLGRGTHRLRCGRLECALGEAKQVAARAYALDVDTDLAPVGDRDQSDAARVAEVEAKRRGGIVQCRLAVLTGAKLDRRRILVQVGREDLAKRPLRSCPVGLAAPDVDLVAEHAREDT